MAQIKRYDKKLAGIGNKILYFTKVFVYIGLESLERKRETERKGEEKEGLKKGREGGKTGDSFTTMILEEIL